MKAQYAVIRINLLSLEESINQPQLTSLSADGWSVVSSIPVEDEGTPYLILRLREPVVERKTYDSGFKLHAVMMALIIIELAYIIFIEIG
jgi:hypothetical protein